MPENAQVVAEDGLILVRAHAPELRPPGMGAPLKLGPARTALVIVDVQQFLETPPFSAMSRVVPPLAGLLPVARAAGLTVVHVKTEFGARMDGAGRPGSRTRQMMDRTGSGLLRGSATAPNRRRTGERVYWKGTHHAWMVRLLDESMRMPSR